MANTPEARQRNPAVNFAKKLGIPVIRLYFGPGMQTGWPDDVFLIPGGRPLFLEAKAPGKKPTPKQEAKLKLLREKGYDADWYDNAEEGITLIKKHYEVARKKERGKEPVRSSDEAKCIFMP